MLHHYSKHAWLCSLLDSADLYFILVVKHVTCCWHCEWYVATVAL